VVNCSGFTQGTALTLAALRAAGATSVAVEDPGHLDMPILVGRTDLNPVFVPVDDLGLSVDRARQGEGDRGHRHAGPPDPTSVVLSPERRLALLQWAEQVSGGGDRGRLRLGVPLRQAGRAASASLA
jgi:GntR family transcriptional regulator / MocR family aminotransferase